MRGLIEKPSFTAKHYETAQGRFLLEAHIGHIHFRDGALKNGAFRDVNTTLNYNAASKSFVMNEASYEAEIGLYGDVRFYNVDHSLQFQLPNPNRVEAASYDGSAFGRLQKALIWRDILQPGGHQIVEARNNSFAKIFHFDQKPVSNIIEFETIISTGLKFSDGISDFDLSKEASRSIKGSQGLFYSGDKLSWIRRPRAWNHRGEIVDVELQFFQRDNRTWVRKIIPQDFIDYTFIEIGAYLETDTTTSFFAGAGDGPVKRSGVDETFSTIRNGAGNNCDPAVTTEYPAGFIASSTTNQFSVLYRSIFPFDTSSLPDGCLINAAMFYVYASNHSEGLGPDTNCIVGATPASYTTLQNSDYGQLGAAEYSDSRIDLKSVGYRSLALNTTGLAAISKTGYTAIGLRSYWDLANSFGGSWATGARSTLTTYYSEQAGTDLDPYLSVLYNIITIGQGSFNLTGQPVSLRLNRKLAIAKGDFVLTGQQVGLKLESVLWIGKDPSTETVLNAIIAMTRISNTVRSDAELLRSYKQGMSETDDEYVIARWGLEDSFITDSTENENDLTASGDVLFTREFMKSAG
jgi:hypothetical protein